MQLLILHVKYEVVLIKNKTRSEPNFYRVYISYRCVLVHSSALRGKHRCPLLWCTPWRPHKPRRRSEAASRGPCTPRPPCSWTTSQTGTFLQRHQRWSRVILSYVTSPLLVWALKRWCHRRLVLASVLICTDLYKGFHICPEICDKTCKTSCDWTRNQMASTWHSVKFKVIFLVCPVDWLDLRLHLRKHTDRPTQTEQSIRKMTCLEIFKSK